jgi:hypothetical protein
MQFWSAIKQAGFPTYRRETGHTIQPIEYMEYPKGWMKTYLSSETKSRLGKNRNPGCGGPGDPGSLRGQYALIKAIRA